MASRSSRGSSRQYSTRRSAPPEKSARGGHADESAARSRPPDHTSGHIPGHASEAAAPRSVGLRGRTAPRIALPDLAALFAEAGFADLAASRPALLPSVATYLEMLTHWNQVTNLVGTRNWQETFRRLLVDSLHLSAFLGALPEDPASSWDLGAGAGLPGLVLRMIWQKGDYWLVEAREKRALFLSSVLARLPLPRTRVFRGRAEAFMAGPPRRTADLVLGRAFLPWRELLDLAGPHLAPGGSVILLLREELGENPCPGWRRKARHAYVVDGDTRFFCALAPVL